MTPVPIGDGSLRGAGSRIRTGDLFITSELLYLLSHTSELRQKTLP